MRIPFVDLKPALQATRAAWRKNLGELEKRSSYILGAEVAAFEEEFASAMGARYAIGAASGTGAIELCLRAAGVHRPEQRVLTSALTAPFTAVAIQAAGATPAFADIDPETLLIDPLDAFRRMDQNTAALLPVHLYGQPCQIDKLAQLARAAKIPLVQDACQAHGARFAEITPLTRFSPFVAYSFYPTKNLGCLGDGGAITTDDPKIIRRLREMRDGGRRDSQIAYVAGINCRLDEMQACYLRAFLPRLSAWNARRAKLAALYDELLAGVNGIRPVRRDSSSIHHLYVVRARRRDRLREFLASQGIGTAVHYPRPLHLHPAFAHCGLKRGDLPHAEAACAEILSLPLGPFVHESAVKEIAAAVRKFYASKGATAHAIRWTPSPRNRRTRIHRQ